jgi:hypothetical protein
VPPELAEELLAVNRDLDSARRRHARHQLRLRPKPQEAATLLGRAEAEFRVIRNGRIRRECKLLHERVERSVGRARGLTADDDALFAALDRFHGPRPASPSGHGIDPDERARRRQALDAWLDCASRRYADVTARIHSLFCDDLDDGAFRALLGAMDDAANFLEFAVLSQSGVLPALRRRHGWRLCRLLRADDGAWEGLE